MKTLHHFVRILFEAHGCTGIQHTPMLMSIFNIYTTLSFFYHIACTHAPFILYMAMYQFTHAPKLFSAQPQILVRTPMHHCLLRISSVTPQYHKI
jgi:hypothetical protein